MEETPQSNPSQSESQRIKAEIARFLREDRLQPKLDKLEVGDDKGRQKLIDEHQPITWVADAARRVAQIQQVTHASKFTHSSADGSGLYCSGNLAANDSELGSHTLGNQGTPDVVGNAAALDVYKFLLLSVDDRTLLDRSKARDSALAEALSDDASQAAEWITAYAALSEAKGGPASHKLAKQLYWPMTDGTYHLLAPLLSSPLAHAIHQRIREDLFSDAARAARHARRAQRAHPHGYRDYPNLAIQKFGGSKPQNISQLNSERRGENYLLASVPPTWISAAIRAPLKTESVFINHFAQRTEVRRLSGVLKDFLRRVVDVETNIRIREIRAELLADLCSEALNMAAELRVAQTPGWTAQSDCQLNLAEQCWLDPARGRSDEDFASVYRSSEWRDEVSLRFANWLNAQLQTERTHFGGPEASEWQTALGNELHLLREELDYE
jgi:CRISPR-associated protein Csy1